MAGITKDGGFAEYCLLDSRTSAKLPDEMSFEQAAPLMCAGVTIYSAIKKAAACGLKNGGVSIHIRHCEIPALLMGPSTFTSTDYRLHG